MLSLTLALALAVQEPVLPGTRLLEGDGDRALEMVDGLRAYLQRRTARVRKANRADWIAFDRLPAEERAAEAARRRVQLAGLLGLDADERVSGPLVVQTPPPGRNLLVSDGVLVADVRWQVYADVQGEGLLMEPKTGQVSASVVYLPHVDTTPEDALQLTKGRPHTFRHSGSRVVVPRLVDRGSDHSGWPGVGRSALPHREWIYRQAYELGRTMTGYEVALVQAAIDGLLAMDPDLPVHLWGSGDGGRIALYTAALDERVARVTVEGAYGPQGELWRAPIDRNVWRIVSDFDDFGLASLIAPRVLHVQNEGWPVERLSGPTPGVLERPEGTDWAELTFKTGMALGSLTPNYPPPDPIEAQGRVVRQWTAHTQALFDRCDAERAASLAAADATSAETWAATVPALRQRFHEEVLGALPAADVPADPRSALAYETDAFRGYRVVVDVWEGVIAYGILLVPKDLAPGERRPVVVCQHGLEGRPEDVVNPDEDTRYYRSFGARLAERGFVVFAPQNPYLGGDNFRELQRMANPIGATLFSIIVRQHERWLEWLGTQPFADPERIAFYGLSYGGKTAMRVPAILDGYCLSICSADFNEWIRKCSSVHFGWSYMYNGEYDMAEWRLGRTFGYAEMAALIAPRPFFVERGHHDGVGVDEWVAHEYAKVRRHYVRLGIGERTGIEFFDGPHEIHGVGTYAFLHQHLDWPAPQER